MTEDNPADTTQYGPKRQQDVYRKGMLEGQPPEFPVAYEELYERAREELSDEAFAYVAGGAGSESTVRANDRAFDDWQIVPRMMRDVSSRDLSIELFGHEYPAPVMLAPIGVQGILHGEAELAVARAAGEFGIPMVLSSVSSYTFEEVAEELGDSPGWFQLYWSSDRDVAASFLERAEAAGYEAVVATLDTPKMGWRERDIELGYLPFLQGQGLKNYFEDPAFCERLEGDDPWADPEASIESWSECFGDASLTWDDLEWLDEQTDLPVLVKGILHPEDARKAVERGVDGLIVSNHGGRQVDGAIPALEALPDVVDAVDDATDDGEDVPVLFDSGIRRGSDVFRAVALGADAVLLGRPYALGLGIGGEDGVRAVLENLLADVDLTVGLSGCASIDEVDRSNVRRADR
ncbi:lactate 2-monooxygenase [Natronorubrum texcoconense]|uniref:FMN-dependent dehydrogenase, includes L-lactate dehydrogenase and type II isopentenyl diphosphate isomerase n=1 Tax=Natronorubrum texcoconense TaxID=1095776 RepID=A0A1G8U746_9EURY|nr:lactate 2-monooxygenase [Natronorubrum texcoconense]SDJ49567.1 FMN-dependent dehydrogenase, includes L-lactate dehydrogenase and type II isopentenyl diphosphate isomerase [Natronorubrum texcoconense]